MRSDSKQIGAIKVPVWVICLIVLAVVTSWLPLALIARSRSQKSERSPIHLFLDMDFQPRYGAQDYQNEKLDVRFNDGRVMRPAVAGAVRHDGLPKGVELDDDHFFRGYATDGNLQPVMEEAVVAGAKVQQPKYFANLPPQILVDKNFIKRGQERYNIFCGVCHGQAGYGDGPVYQRVQERQNLDASAIVGFAQPRNLHDGEVATWTDGKLYDIITRGKFTTSPEGVKTYTMYPYASQIKAVDRWAIVAYIRALQLAQNFPTEQLSEDLKKQVDMAPQIARPQIKAPASGGSDDAGLDDPALIAQGKLLFTTKICMTCHQVDPKFPAPAGLALKAPPFVGKFWGKEVEVTLGPGGPEAKVIFNLDYFVESVAEPMKKIVKGSIPGMAPLPTTDEERKALAAYVKSLSQ